jgi:hypothetical protein
MASIANSLNSSIPGAIAPPLVENNGVWYLVFFV